MASPHRSPWTDLPWKAASSKSIAHTPRCDKQQRHDLSPTSNLSHLTCTNTQQQRQKGSFGISFIVNFFFLSFFSSSLRTKHIITNASIRGLDAGRLTASQNLMFAVFSTQGNGLRQQNTAAGVGLKWQTRAQAGGGKGPDLVYFISYDNGREVAGRRGKGNEMDLEGAEGTWLFSNPISNFFSLFALVAANFFLLLLSFCGSCSRQNYYLFFYSTIPIFHLFLFRPCTLRSFSSFPRG